MKTVLLLIFVLMLSGCAVTKEEAAMNGARMDTFKQLNAQRTYQPVTITGVQRMEGENITITTTSELQTVQAPNLQYDTSRNEIVGKAVGIAGNVIMGGIAAVAAVEVTKAIGEASKQPAPVVVKPEVVTVPEGSATTPDPVLPAPDATTTGTNSGTEVYDPNLNAWIPAP